MKVSGKLIGYIICIALIILTLCSSFFSSSDFIRSLGIYLFLGAFLITYLIIQDPEENTETVVQKKDPSYNTTGKKVPTKSNTIKHEGKRWRDLDGIEWLRFVFIPVGALLISGYVAYKDHEIAERKIINEELRYNQERDERKLMFEMERETHKTRMEEHQWKKEEYQWNREERKKQKEQEEIENRNR
ncbi:MAG: DUF4670 domain-containing protein [Tannerella sp.]|jgi:hypothetical protein|nr:DUF4670 domain-containing protein [Tannerella sp.]